MFSRFLKIFLFIPFLTLPVECICQDRIVVSGEDFAGYEGNFAENSDMYPEEGVRVSPGQGTGRVWYDFNASNISDLEVQFTWVDNSWYSDQLAKKVQIYNWGKDKFETIYTWYGNDRKEHTTTLKIPSKPEYIKEHKGTIRIGFWGDVNSVIHLKTVELVGKKKCKAIILKNNTEFNLCVVFISPIDKIEATKIEYTIPPHSRSKILSVDEEDAPAITFGFKPIKWLSIDDQGNLTGEISTPIAAGLDISIFANTGGDAGICLGPGAGIGAGIFEAKLSAKYCKGLKKDTVKLTIGLITVNIDLSKISEIYSTEYIGVVGAIRKTLDENGWKIELSNDRDLLKYKDPEWVDDWIRKYLAGAVSFYPDNPARAASAINVALPNQYQYKYIKGEKVRNYFFSQKQYNLGYAFASRHVLKNEEYDIHIFTAYGDNEESIKKDTCIISLVISFKVNGEDFKQTFAVKELKISEGSIISLNPKFYITNLDKLASFSLKIYFKTDIGSVEIPL